MSGITCTWISTIFQHVFFALIVFVKHIIFDGVSLFTHERNQP